MNLLSRYRRRFSLGLLGFLLAAAHPIYTQAQQQAGSTPLSILIVGDSLSAEYGLKRGSGWVEHLKITLTKTYPAIEIINASISGDTTSGGLARIKTLLERTKPNIVLVELGGNDALRGLPLSMTKTNLLEMVRAITKSGARPILAGMQIPPNYGREYTSAFKTLYSEIAIAEQIALIPFFLEGIAENPAMFQADGIHPNVQAQPFLMENVRKILIPMISLN
jgi:acyl-CoA thioesterase-1